MAKMTLTPMSNYKAARLRQAHLGKIMVRNHQCEPAKLARGIAGLSLRSGARIFPSFNESGPGYFCRELKENRTKRTLAVQFLSTNCIYRKLEILVTALKGSSITKFQSAKLA